MTLSSDYSGFDPNEQYPESYGIGTFTKVGIDGNGYMIYEFQDPRYDPVPFVLSFTTLFAQWGGGNI